MGEVSHDGHDNDDGLLSNIFYRAANKGKSISYPLWFINEIRKSNTAYNSTFRKWKTLCQDVATKSVQSVRNLSTIFSAPFKKNIYTVEDIKAYEERKRKKR